MAPPKFFCCMRRNPMPAARRPLLGSCCEKRGEALLGLVEPVRVERGKGGALCGRARNAGVHLRQLGFVLLAGGWRVSVSCGCALRYSRSSAAEAGLAESQMSAWRKAACASGSFGMRLENADAFGAGVLVVGEHDAQLRRHNADRRGCARPGRACRRWLLLCRWRCRRGFDSRPERCRRRADGRRRAGGRCAWHRRACPAWPVRRPGEAGRLRRWCWAWPRSWRCWDRWD